jgi:hypothetical protein
MQKKEKKKKVRWIIFFKKTHLLKNIIDSNNKKNYNQNSKIPFAKKKQEFHVWKLNQRQQ